MSLLNADFETLAEQRSSGSMSEFWYFLRHNKRWWLTPIVLVMAFLSLPRLRPS